jgi:hypothetical protein
VVAGVAAALTGIGIVLASSGVALAVTDDKGREMTPAEVAEKESRKACKVQICSIFRSKQTSGEKVACDIQKSWREDDIKDMVAGGKIGWRWGNMVCKFNLDLTQAELADAVAKPDYDLKVKPHTINCEVAGKDGAEGHTITVGIAPEVKFKDGKATEGRMNWGDIEAPVLVKGIVWPGVKLDNQVNFVGGKLVRLVNDFMTKKCDEVKDQLPQ